MGDFEPTALDVLLFLGVAFAFFGTVAGVAWSLARAGVRWAATVWASVTLVFPFVAVRAEEVGGLSIGGSVAILGMVTGLLVACSTRSWFAGSGPIVGGLLGGMLFRWTEVIGVRLVERGVAEGSRLINCSFIAASLLFGACTIGVLEVRRRRGSRHAG